MKTIRTTLVAAGIAVLMAASAQARMAVQFIGTGAQTTPGDAMTIAGVNLATDTTLTAADIANYSTVGQNNFAGCFLASMVDTASGATLGNGIDCIRVMRATESGAIELEAVSFFVFTDMGTLVAKGSVTLQPVLMGAGDANGTITHLSGAVDSSGIVGGTGAFAGATGSVRLNGSVNISNFPQEMVFDCLWVVGAGQSAFSLSTPGEVATRLDRIQMLVDAIAHSRGIIVP